MSPTDFYFTLSVAKMGNLPKDTTRARKSDLGRSL